MAFQQNIPQPTDQLSQSQSDLLNNNISLYAWAGTNHVIFDATGAGKHSFVEFPTQSPAPTTIAGEVGLYSVVSTLTSQPELVFSHQLGSTAPVGAQIVEFTSAGWSAPGWARLPSGILIKWGNATVTGYGTITFPTGATIPVFTDVFFMEVTPQSGVTTDPNVMATLNGLSITPTNFAVYGSARITTAPATVLVAYLAIGI